MSCEFCGGPDLPARRHSASIVVGAQPAQVYRLVSDVTRTGEFSPVCRACWWDDPGTGPVVGAWFTGRNETPDRVWETRCRVTAADPPRAFAFDVNGGFVQWAYTLVPAAGGTELTESWEFRAAGLRAFHDRHGDQAHARIQVRVEQALSGIPATLAAIRSVAEAGG